MMQCDGLTGESQEGLPRCLPRGSYGAPRGSQETPREFPEASRKFPKGLPWGSCRAPRRLPGGFPGGSQRAPRGFQGAPRGRIRPVFQRAPRDFPWSSQRPPGALLAFEKPFENLLTAFLLKKREPRGDQEGTLWVVSHRSLPEDAIRWFWWLGKATFWVVWEGVG